MAPTKAATTAPTVNNNIPKNWEKDDNVFTGDEVINAFYMGKEAGMDEYKRIVFSQFKENIQKATELSEKFLQALSQLQVVPLSIHLKAEDITSFKALFVVTKDAFLNDSFRQVYTLARQYKNNSETEKFYINFSFTPHSEHLDEHCLVADGFGMKYEKK